MKQCTRCKRVLPKDNFRVRSDKTGNRQRICRRCECEYSNKYAKINRKRITQDRREYQKDYKQKNKKHLNDIQRRRYHEVVDEKHTYYSAYRNTERSRDFYLKRRYGITLAEFNEKLKQQENGCAICGSVNGKANKRNDRLTVDHNHATGELRGILCHRCNWGLGQFDDDTELLVKAIEYLKSYNLVSSDFSEGKTIKGDMR